MKVVTASAPPPKPNKRFFSSFIFTLHNFDLSLCVIIQVVDIMKVNVEKVLERDAKLSELDNRAGTFRHFID